MADAAVDDERRFGGEPSGKSRRRRRGGAAAGNLRSVLDTMAARPPTLQTLPPDGTVLEELITDLEAEYGTPSTPQEYRLIIKVASAEERAASSEEASKRPGEEEATRPATARRRRRGNRRQGRKKVSASGETERAPASRKAEQPSVSSET